MSFLSGILSVGKSAVKFLSGNSILSSLAKTAILGLAVNKLSKSANKGNNVDTKNIDQGVRLQAKPDAAAKIPVLYGSAFFGGNISDAAMTNANRTMWYCLVLAEKTGSIYSTGSGSSYVLNNVYWNNQRIVFNSDGVTANYAVDTTGVIDRSISGLVRVYFYAGGRTAGQVPSGYSGSVPNAETLFPNWTSGTHAMSNLIFALVRVDYNREKNVTGIGDMLFNVTNSMRFPGDVLYDYLTNTTYGAGISSGNILTTDITALNNYSSQSINYDDQGTGSATLTNRYQINGLIDTENSVLQNAEKILSSAASWLSYDTHQGKWGVVINKTETSSASFDDSNILGSISLSGTGLQDLYNQVKVEFPHRELRDSADFYNIEVPDTSIPADWADFSRNANEEDNILNLAYDIINEPVQAQMLGLIELKQSRLDKIIQFETDFSYYNLKAGDIIDVTNSRFNFSSKLFRIITITEVQDDGGALQMQITALEYNQNVYSITDLFRFTRSDEDGIITIGSIGIPGTPSVSKIEKDARPRIIITSTAPTGVVEGMEFWLTTDVGIPTDANRSYTLIGVKRPVGGGVFTSGTSVQFEFVTNASDLFVKTRGFNATTVGQFSNVSGLVEFAPTQVTDAIDINTQAFDSTGGLLGALALVELLGKLSDLFPEGEDGKSLFEKIFDLFEEETGVDLVGQASDGELVVASDLEIKADGTSLGATTASIDFQGAIEASGSDDIEVKLIDGAEDKDILAWNAATEQWQLISGCITCEFDEVVPPGVEQPCSLVISDTLPPSNFNADALCQPTTDVPYIGNYYITYTIDPGFEAGVSVKAGNFITGQIYLISLLGDTDFTLIGADSNTVGEIFQATGPGEGSGWANLRGAAKDEIILYGPIEKGIGNVYLYGTDGTLEQTLTEGQINILNNVIELPFANRVPGKDYYILMDEGLLTYCTCESVKVNLPTTWTFTTSTVLISGYSSEDIAEVINLDTTQNLAKQLTVTGVTPIGSNRCLTSNELEVTFNENIKAGSGSLIIRERLSGTTVATFAAGSATIEDNVASFGQISGLSAGVAYDIVIPAGFMLTDRQETTFTQEGCGGSGPTITVPAGPQLASEPALRGFAITADLTITSVEFCLGSGTGLVTRNSNIKINFNKNFTISESGPALVTIFGGGSVHQDIDLNGDFENDGYGEIYSISGNVLTLNPTKQFLGATDYYINISSTAILDPNCSAAFPGVTDNSTIAWRTEGIETTLPSGPTFASVLLYFDFNRPVGIGSGKINIIDANTGELYTQISALHPAIKFSEEPFI